MAESTVASSTEIDGDPSRVGIAVSGAVLSNAPVAAIVIAEETNLATPPDLSVAVEHPVRTVTQPDDIELQLDGDQIAPARSAPVVPTGDQLAPARSAPVVPAIRAMPATMPTAVPTVLGAGSSPRQPSSAEGAASPRRVSAEGAASPRRPGSAEGSASPRRPGSAEGSGSPRPRRGESPAEVQARIVRQHEEEVLMMRFHRWILVFSLIVCLATPVAICFLVWLTLSWFENKNIICDVPLRTWFYGVFSIVVFNTTVNRPSAHGSCVQRYLCRWKRDPADPQMPKRVRVYNLMITLFVLGWNCLGLYWVATDGDSKTEPSCKSASPSLYHAVQVYATFNLVITVFMYANMFGFSQCLRMALRRGLLHTSHGAPKGSLEKATEVAKLNDPLVTENPSCSVCLEDFNREKVFLKTKACNHLFHKECLKNWLQVSRTCPLCRKDLSITDEDRLADGDVPV